MFLAKAALLLALPALVALSALPGALIKRSRTRTAAQNVADFRDTLPPTAEALDDPEQAELDAKWSAYWANSQAESNALRADMNAYVGEMAGLEEHFAAGCDDIVKRFTIDALAVQREIASDWGGWKSNVDREADLVIQRSGHGADGIATLNHRLKVEVAECTSTCYTQADAEALVAEIEAELALETSTSRRHRA